MFLLFVFVFIQCVFEGGFVVVVCLFVFHSIIISGDDNVHTRFEGMTTSTPDTSAKTRAAVPSRGTKHTNGRFH